MRRLLFLNDFQHSVGKPKLNRSIYSLRVNARIFSKSKMGAINKCVSIKKEEFFGQLSHAPKINKDYQDYAKAFYSNAFLLIVL